MEHKGARGCGRSAYISLAIIKGSETKGGRGGERRGSGGVEGFFIDRNTGTLCLNSFFRSGRPSRNSRETFSRARSLRDASVGRGGGGEDKGPVRGLLDFLSELGPGSVDGYLLDPVVVRTTDTRRCIDLTFRRAANCGNELTDVSFSGTRGRM